MMIRVVGGLTLALMFTSSAQAAPNCYVQAPGAHLSFGIIFGEEMSERERNEFNLMRLKQRGVDATRAEMWGGCIRAFVRKPGGGEEMQFFHPDTFARVE